MFDSRARNLPAPILSNLPALRKSTNNFGGFGRAGTETLFLGRYEDYTFGVGGAFLGVTSLSGGGGKGARHTDGRLAVAVAAAAADWSGERS
jgi:hypothetical protein